MACVKVYLCSNPDESVMERKVLRECVVPKLRDHCRRTHGVDFRVIDPYEETNPDNWPTQRVRLQLIEECRLNSLGPFFVGLVGEQYGTSCLPEQVELSEFFTVLQVSQQMGFSSEILEKCYKRDDNNIPPVFCLISQEEYKKQPDQIRPVNETDENSWEDALVKGRRILHFVVSQCVLKGLIDPQQAHKYFSSGLENDLRFAMDGRSAADIKRCLCYVYKTSKTTSQTRKNRNEPHSVLQSQSGRLSELCNNFLPNLVKTHGALIYTTSSAEQECDDEQIYAEGLSHQLYSDLLHLVDKTVVRERNQTHDTIVRQENLCRNLSSLYRIERSEVAHVKAYLAQDTKYPFVLVGGPCTGKSVLLAHCASQMKIWLKDQEPVVITHFADRNCSLKQIFISICHQIALHLNQQYNPCLKDIYRFRETFQNLLSMSSLSQNPLILILDGLDQLEEIKKPLDLTWLPNTLPSNVKIFISTTPTKSGFLSAVRTHYPESTLLFELEPLDSKRCSQMLKSLLTASNRRVTSGQQMYVNEAFKKCSLPLYVELLYRQVCCWDSMLEITSDTVVPGVHTNIGLLLDNLEAKHGKVLVARTLEYLNLSRFGLTESELTDLLSCDDDILPAYLPIKDSAPYRLRVPEVAVERLLLDLKGFLQPQKTSGIQTLSLVSRHFKSVIYKRYLCLNEQLKIHSLMAHYFSGRWASGTAKSLINKAGLSRDKNLNSAQNEAGQIKVYTDRQVPGQPWIFQSFITSCATLPNLRKLQELPFHLMKGENIKELVDVLMSQEFLQGMFCASLGEALIFMLEKTSQILSSRELRLLLCVLKSSVCRLKDCSAELMLVLQAKLFSFFQVLPALKNSVCQTGHNDGVNMVVGPTPTVPATYWAPPNVESSPVLKVAISQSGFAVVIQNNGSAWVWNGSDSEGFKLPQYSDLEFTDVRCSADVFILFTQTGTLLLWNVNVLSDLQKVYILQRDPKDVTSIDGVLSSRGKTFVFSKESSNVQVFAEGMEVTRFQCCCSVTCISCSDDYIICCGQSKGTVSVFDFQSGSSLVSFTCSTELALFDLIIHDHQDMITCIDCTGSVFVWDINNITEPVLIKEMLSTTKNNVLNIDHVDCNLLICKREQIQFICGHLLEVQDHLKAPKGKTFVQAVLDHDAHFIIAFLKDSPFLLVWNRVSGQCVLKVDNGSSQAFGLIKGDTYLTAVTSTGIVNWDLELISVAASIPKSGARILKMIIESQGVHLYTTDGSEIVWKWRVLEGRVESHLLHHGSVKALVLSGDDTYLVTVASGDIYVWNSNTNENIYRIRGSKASSVLTTPNGNFAVSLSETGPSKVWKLCDGHVVCNIHHHVINAVISPESTFLMGINREDLVAISLWSGCVSKRFRSSTWSKVVAFHPLPDHPDYVVVITISGVVYSWRLTEDTVCQQFLCPESFQYPMQFFKISSNGSYGIVSVDGLKVTILDVYHGKLCSLNAEGEVCQQFVDISSKYAVYICHPRACCQNYLCDPNTKQILVAIRVSDGKTVGRFYLCNNPSALKLSETLFVYVGFEDGSVGVYTISDSELGDTNTYARCQSAQIMCPFDDPVVWEPLANPNLTWIDVASELL
ncbi:NACHT and WD repeat domain-containing protein 2 [Trichomycterus rosablanca]|uniref:NACHT and WD repeat domain-containing protein 2 n=1 Tax=Trichomycterus rosablanca TaxID=2290929 RepID=UPI002F35846A